MKKVDGIPFECTKCGKCCKWDGVVNITPEDANRLSKHLKISDYEFVTKYMVGNVLAIKEDSKDCIFLDNNKCTVWDAKPIQCVEYPKKIDTRCPGFQIDRSIGMRGYEAALKMIKSKLSNEYDYTQNIMNNLYKDLNSSLKSISVTSMVIDSGMDNYLKDSAVKVASLDDLFSFDRVDKSHLIHKATRDLWTIDTDKSGAVQITRLFDNSGEPIKG